MKATWAVACLISAIILVGIEETASAADNVAKPSAEAQPVAYSGPADKLGPEHGLYRASLFAGRAPGKFPLAPLLRAAMTRNAVQGMHYQGRWRDIGTPQRLAELDEWLRA